jgi:hypothetical protein
MRHAKLMPIKEGIIELRRRVHRSALSANYSQPFAWQSAPRPWCGFSLRGGAVQRQHDNISASGYDPNSTCWRSSATVPAMIGKSAPFLVEHSTELRTRARCWPTSRSRSYPWCRCWSRRRRGCRGWRSCWGRSCRRRRRSCWCWGWSIYQLLIGERVLLVGTVDGDAPVHP